MKKIFTTYERLCKLPLGGSLWGLLFFFIFIVACTEETAEVDDLVRKERYVTVCMQVPGMTATTTRAADGVIESVTALAFDTNGNLLKVVSATDITTERFNLTVPNGTTTIHFLANLSGSYNLSGVLTESDMTTLTTNDYDNLVYWGMTTYEGSTNTLSTTLYRNMAKITLAPDEEFPFEGELTIAGLDNPNTSGTLVPYNNGFHNTGVAPTYLTLPDGVEKLEDTPIGNDGAGYGTSLYVFEHANSNYEDKGLFVICRIGDAFYKVALTNDGKNPYQIIRNHEYIIYVSDVDDYQSEEYRSTDYYATFGKKPINLEVKQIAQVAFSNTGDKAIEWNNGNPSSFNVEMSNIAEGTVTLTIAAEGFRVTQGGNELQKVEGNYTYTGGNTTFTFTPTAIGEHQITITGSGQYATVQETTINVNVQASIKAEADKTQLYYDSDDTQTVTVNVTVPDGVETLNISAPDFSFGEDADGDYTYTVNGQTNISLQFTLKSGITETKTSSITIRDASGIATQAPVSINLVKTPVQTNTLTVTPITSTTIGLSGSGNNTVQLRFAIPSDLSYLRINTNYAFTVSALNGYTQPRSQAPNYYYDYISPGSVNTIDLEFTINADYIFEVAGQYPISFYAAQDSSEGITTTIMVVNKNLDDGVIWEGNKTATGSGYILKYTSFSEYRDSSKQLKIDVTSTSDSWKQLYIRYEGDNNNLGALQGSTIDSTLSIDIPSQDKDLIISGEGGITITKIYVE